jgi:hypothetical protein
LIYLWVKSHMKTLGISHKATTEAVVTAQVAKTVPDIYGNGTALAIQSPTTTAIVKAVKEGEAAVAASVAEPPAQVGAKA